MRQERSDKLRLRSSAAVALVCALTVASISACSLDDDTPAPATSEASPTSEPPPPPPQPSPTAEERVPQDLRAKVASLMVVGVSNYDQARFALDQGAGGLIIPSLSLIHI